jgi:hypothetical protein
MPSPLAGPSIRHYRRLMQGICPDRDMRESGFLRRGVFM